MVEVEFGRRLAQGIVVAFADSAPVEETKPIISLIDPDLALQSNGQSPHVFLTHTI